MGNRERTSAQSSIADIVAVELVRMEAPGLSPHGRVARLTRAGEALDRLDDLPEPVGLLHGLASVVIINPDAVVVASIGVAAAKAGGAFLETFGHDLGAWCADRLTKLRILRHWRSGSRYARHGERDITFLMPAPDDGRVPDAAVLALVDLDLSDGRFDGETMRWDAETNAWLPHEQLSRHSKEKT